MSLKTRSILVITVGTILGVSLSLGGNMVAERQQPGAAEMTREQARLFTEVMDRVKRDYVKPLDDDALLDSAIRGMVSELDPHSEYLDAEEFRDIRISTSGSYSGVGLEVSTADGQIVVVTPIDDSPAHKAGILAGDVILAIDGATVENEGLNDTISRMRGRAGSTVAITLSRGVTDDPIDFSLRREKIKVASVRHEIIEPSLGYARVSQFSETTAKELSHAIDEMNEASQQRHGSMLSGLILDLRNNPGGILDAAVDVTDLFLDYGVIVQADGRTAESRFTREARRGDILDGASMAVLVNKGAASASEIVAGALQDHNRALVIGTPTFGKGLVQTVMPLSKGRAIKLTTSHYYTPSGDSINEVGVSPDVLVEGSPDYPGLSISFDLDLDGDEQLKEAIDRLNTDRILHSSAN
jgi:carboxyl-terminal processing protease